MMRSNRCKICVVYSTIIDKLDVNVPLVSPPSARQDDATAAAACHMTNALVLLLLLLLINAATGRSGISRGRTRDLPRGMGGVPS